MINLPEIKSALIGSINEIDPQKKSTYENLDYPSMMRTLGEDTTLLEDMINACNSAALLPHLHFACLSAYLAKHNIDATTNPHKENEFMDKGQDVQQWNINAYQALQSELWGTQALPKLNIHLLMINYQLPLNPKESESFHGLAKMHHETRQSLINMLRRIEKRLKDMQGNTSKIQADIQQYQDILNNQYPDFTELTKCAKKIEYAMHDSYAWDDDDRKILNAALFGFLALAVVGILLMFAASLTGPWVLPLIVGVIFGFVGFCGAIGVRELADLKDGFMPPLVEKTQSFAKVSSQSFFNKNSDVIKTTNSVDDKTACPPENLDFTAFHQGYV